MDSAASNEKKMGWAILGGTLLPAIVAGIAGVVVALSTWNEVVSTPVRIFGGGLMGGGAALLVAGVLAWHGAGIAAGDHAEGAPIWGIFPGIVVGASIMPVLTFVLGLPASEALGGGLFGLFAGPLVGIAGWEIGYWGVNLAK